jgi:hypothetical protein
LHFEFFPPKLLAPVCHFCGRDPPPPQELADAPMFVAQIFVAGIFNF